MRYGLYYADGSASMGVRVLLEEIGAAYDLIGVTIDPGQPRSAEHLRLNPNGWVPVLTWEGHAMYECAAITIFLCDRHPEAGLAPAAGDNARGRFLQSLVYFSNTVQTAFQQDYYPDRFAQGADGFAQGQQRGLRRLREVWGVIDAQIGDDEWILGDRFSAADIYLFMLITWLRPERGQPSYKEFPNVRRVAEAVMNRPAVQRVYGEWISVNG